METDPPVMRRPPSALTVVSQVDLGSHDASINMDTDHEDNKGSQISVNSASALLNDICHRASISASVYKEPVDELKLETPDDGSFSNQSVVDLSLDQCTLTLKGAEQSSPNSDLASLHLGVASLLRNLRHGRVHHTRKPHCLINSRERRQESKEIYLLEFS